MGELHIEPFLPFPWNSIPISIQMSSVQFSSVQSLSHVQLFSIPWTAASQASLSITNSRSLLKLMPIESVMPSNHLILCCPLLLLPSIFPRILHFVKNLGKYYLPYLTWQTFWTPVVIMIILWRKYKWLRYFFSKLWNQELKSIFNI